MAWTREEATKRLRQLETTLRSEVPELRIKEKRSSVVMNIAYYGLLMFIWNKQFMESYWTTLGKTIYIPYIGTYADDPFADYATLFHERKHLTDLMTLEGKVSQPVGGLLWALGYGFPQVLALGALGAFWSPWWLLWLVCLGPWPAPFRVWIEKRGYRATIMAWWQSTGHLPSDGDPWLDHLVEKTFCGWNYYRMSWRPKAIRRWFLDQIAELRRSGVHP